MSRKQLNTTVEADLLLDFQAVCKEKRLTMNVVLEAFMRSFIDGTLSLKITSTGDGYVEDENKLELLARKIEAWTEAKKNK